MSQTALTLDENEWQSLRRICESYRSPATEWAETDEDKEALEVRSARELCTRIIEATS